MKELKSKGAKYRLLETLGAGQSATVFKAIREDPKGHAHQMVAIKVFHGSSSVLWLRREFETLARVNSPYCVRLLALESVGEQDALVLELVDGVSLYELAMRFEFTDDLIAEAVAQIQDGLRALQELGLHHGDLSPKNVLVDRDGFIRLIDFATDGAGACERGTPHYMAPELWHGGKTSLAADLFALGMIAHDLKSGFGHNGRQQFPTEVADCRSRAFRMAHAAEAGLLVLNPKLRNMLKGRSNPEKRAALCALVREALQRKLTIKTAPMGELPPVSRSSLALRRMAGHAVSMFAIMAMPLGFKTVSFRDGGMLASLSVRSQSWVRIAVNGRDAGYAPLEIRNLRPGTHRLSWSSHASGGEVLLSLASGENKLLTELDLEKRGGLKRH